MYVRFALHIKTEVTRQQAAWTGLERLLVACVITASQLVAVVLVERDNCDILAAHNQLATRHGLHPFWEAKFSMLLRQWVSHGMTSLQASLLHLNFVCQTVRQRLDASAPLLLVSLWLLHGWSSQHFQHEPQT